MMIFVAKRSVVQRLAKRIGWSVFVARMDTVRAKKNLSAVSAPPPGRETRVKWHASEASLTSE